MSAVDTGNGVVLSFTTPSAVALALDVSRRAAGVATTLQLTIVHEEIKAPSAAAFGVTSESIPILYDFLEQAMISAVFAYQAIEAFANHVISREVTSSMEVTTRGKSKVLTPDELERRLSLDEKLSQVLPLVRDIASPKGTSLWERFRKLEEARDSTVHLKVKDQYAKDNDGLFFRMLRSSTDDFPRAAANVIQHYFKSGSEPRWLLRFLGATAGT